MASRCRFDLPGYRIACTHTAAEPDEWDVTVPPPLSAAGSSHLWLGRLGRLIFPDVVIRIPRPMSESIMTAGWRCGTANDG